MTAVVIAVDVGTTSARAGAFNASGDLLGRGEHPIRLERPQADHAEHAADDIWRAVTHAVRAAVASAGCPATSVRGLAFDATCSLVVRDVEGGPLGVSTSGDPSLDTIVWLDHRAVAEAERCTASGHRVLDFIGGVMSPEMETPKVMWLKAHLGADWGRVGHLFDLADYLSWRATGSLDRSVCTLTCKWGYLAHEEHPWPRDFQEALGVGDLVERGRLPARAKEIGTDLGPLTPRSVAELGLSPDCRVGVGLIDAHAGALGLLGGAASGPGDTLDRGLALIAGTSSCHMALSPEPRPVHGVWGPYRGAVLPGRWCNEGGQSATGALLDHVLSWHSAGGEPTAALHAKVVERVLDRRRAEGDAYAARLHVLPDFHGNRSPLADPHAVGVVSGLTLDKSFDSLCRLYYRTAVAIALGTRHIVDAMNAKGFAIDTLFVTGGHTKNPLLMTLYADATGLTVVEPGAEDAVLLGTAMAAAAAAGVHPTLEAAAGAMHRKGRSRSPDPRAETRFDTDYRAFLLMHEQRRALDALVSPGSPG